MSDIRINEGKCKGCGICAGECPFGAILVEDKKARINENCTMCGSCVKSCPFGAIQLIRDEDKKENIAACSGIWVFVEQRQEAVKSVSCELIGKARELAKDLKTDVTAVMFGYNIGQAAASLSTYGANRVLYADEPWLASFDDYVYGQLMVRLIKLHHPEAVLIGATSNGRSMAPRIASSLRTGLTADCTGLSIDTDERLLLQTRPAFGGNLMATIVCPHTRPQMATVRPKVFKAPEPEQNPICQIERITGCEAITGRVRKIRDIPSEEGVSLADAEIIVGVGMGMGGPANLHLAFELAEALGGTVGASRPAVDAGWLPYMRQIGQTGKTVAPRVYIACGISGAIQHIAGLADIETVIAINRDPEAPIFKAAHYGVVGDCLEIMPMLTSMMQKYKTDKPAAVNEIIESSFQTC